MPDQVVVTDDDGVRIVRMNRPEKKNALTQPMYAEMTRALREAEGSDTIRCVIFAGSPGAFCAGSDISDFQKRAEGGLKPITVDFLHALVRNSKPLVAAVDGLAIGIGTTMLLHCDYVVAASGAIFARPSCTRLGSASGRNCAMCPRVLRPTSPYSAASGSSPIPTLSSTIQMIREKGAPRVGGITTGYYRNNARCHCFAARQFCGVRAHRRNSAYQFRRIMASLTPGSRLPRGQL